MSLLAFALAAWAAVYANGAPGTAFSDMLIVDGFATFFRVLVIVVGMLSVLCSYQYLKREHAESGEYYALMLFSVVGQCVMVTANELIMIFIGLEITSIATYILAGYLRDDKRNNEAALKYFLLGSFATAFLLYGIAWIYGPPAHQPGRDPDASLSNRRIANPVAGRHGGGADVRRIRFQGFGRAVSDLGAGRLSGRARAGDAVHVGGPKAAAFAVFVRVFMTALRPDHESLGAVRVVVRAADDDHRQLRRADADRTSSGCWRTARSRTPDTSWWRSRRTTRSALRP